MEQEITNEQLAELGIKTGGFTTYETIRVDNGDNKAGLNRTGEYVIKTKDQVGQFVRRQMGVEMDVVILATRARVNSKYKDGVDGWYSNEFISGLQSPVVVHKGSGDSKQELFTGTYEGLRTQFSVPDGNGGVTKNYVYSTILYVYDIKTAGIYKVLLRGMSQGKYFDYSSSLNKDDVLLSFITKMGIALDNTDDKDSYYATFEKGEPVDVKEMFGHAKEVLGNMPPAPSLLNSGQAAQVEQPAPTPVQQAPAGLQQAPPVQAEVVPQDAVTLDTPVNDSDIANVKF